MTRRSSLTPKQVRRRNHKANRAIARGRAARDEAMVNSAESPPTVDVDFNAIVDTVPDTEDKSVVSMRRADLRHVALTALGGLHGMTIRCKVE